MASLLVIGGTGFFGKSILDAFQRGLLETWSINKISILSRNATSLNRTHSELMTPDIELIDDDICTTRTLVKADYVIHAAASTDASRYLKKGNEEKRNIIQGVLNYCHLAKKFHKNSKVLFCSSGAIYGFQAKGIECLEESSGHGDHAELDISKQSYAAAKKDSELAIVNLGEEGISVSIARCFSFVGKYLPKNQHFAIGNFIGDALQGKPVEVKAKNCVYRSYLYADDLVIWLMTIAQASSTMCPIINVGSNESVELHDLGIKISKLFSVGKRIKNISEKVEDRYIPCISKAMYDLGLRVETSLDDAILKSR